MDGRSPKHAQILILDFFHNTNITKYNNWGNKIHFKFIKF